MATKRRGRPLGAKAKPKPPINLDDVLSRPTCQVPIAAQVLGIRGNGYAEAKRGEIPIIRFGRRMMVPTKTRK